MHRSEQTFVRAATDDVVARLPRHADVGGVTVDLSPRWRPGSVEGARCSTATWRRGRVAGTATLEVRPAGWGWSELEVRWHGAGPPRWGHGRQRDATPTVARTLGAIVDGRALGAPRPPAARPVRGRTLVAAATTIALVGASLVIGPLTAPTPVTADDALAQFRAAAEGATTAARVASGTNPGSGTEGGPDATDPASDGLATAPPEARTTPAPSTVGAVAPTSGSDTTDEAPASTPSGAPAPEAAPAPTPATAGPDGPQRSESSAARPPAGVYRYATDGWEELDTRGSHRRFPEETVQVVHHTDCGFRQVWEPIAERRDEHGFCVDVDPPLLVTTDTARSFYGQERRQHFTCSPVRTVADGWTARCTDPDGTSMTVTTRREGTERRTVGGRSVEVARLRVEAELSGETTGWRRSTVWVRASDGLLVRSEVEAELEAPGPVGRVGYRERYVLDLVDLEART
ncbi:hypothetical protein [Nitriliruptor alkaliphilus]|uniref:hypothetical protein n=1 Tax=Nitriliruptor alkaliphilus TaxID=427918 RepID=UPI000696F630|nr:hypothetical protein [Nitriliruptor alkaliphilus]